MFPYIVWASAEYGSFDVTTVVLANIVGAAMLSIIATTNVNLLDFINYTLNRI